jgi:hypothetical protein
MNQQDSLIDKKNRKMHFGKQLLFLPLWPGKSFTTSSL